ncbi:MAG: ribosomal L7Ae/L30e/S12e/Gadd45 family protein [Clostridia bacterium]|nr:ribosomal L7Ae/L30e/S12e/Gadd45 family protein [Clostridia bacterium]
MDKIYGILGIASKAGKVVSGFDAVSDMIKRRKVNLLIVAEETSEKTKKEMEFLSSKFQVPLVIFGTIEENSHAIGKKNRAVMGICDLGLANKFLELTSK